MVLVKVLSMSRKVSMKELRRASAAVERAWRKRRACRIWVARRSVGVGEVVGDDEPGVSGLEGVYAGLWVRGGRSS